MSSLKAIFCQINKFKEPASDKSNVGFFTLELICCQLTQSLISNPVVTIRASVVSKNTGGPEVIVCERWISGIDEMYRK